MGTLLCYQKVAKLLEMMGLHQPPHTKVDVAKSNTTKIWTSTFEWYVVRYGSKNMHQKMHVFRNNWTTCSKYANHSKFNSQCDGGRPIRHSMIMRIFTLKMIRYSYQLQIIWGERLWAQFGFTCIVQEVDSERKYIQIAHVYFTRSHGISLPHSISVFYSM